MDHRNSGCVWVSDHHTSTTFEAIADICYTFGYLICHVLILTIYRACLMPYAKHCNKKTADFYYFSHDFILCIAGNVRCSNWAIRNLPFYPSSTCQKWVRTHALMRGPELLIYIYIYFFLLDPPTIRCYIKCPGKWWTYSNGWNKRWWRGTAGSIDQGSRLLYQLHAPDLWKVI